LAMGEVTAPSQPPTAIDTGSHPSIDRNMGCTKFDFPAACEQSR
jgi:hypothetical protein